MLQATWKEPLEVAGRRSDELLLEDDSAGSSVWLFSVLLVLWHILTFAKLKWVSDIVFRDNLSLSLCYALPAFIVPAPCALNINSCIKCETKKKTKTKIKMKMGLRNQHRQTSEHSCWHDAEQICGCSRRFAAWLVSAPTPPPLIPDEVLSKSNDKTFRLLPLLLSALINAKATNWQFDYLTVFILYK